MTTLAYNGESAIPAFAQQRQHQAHHALGTDIDLTLFGSDSDQYLQTACQLIDQYEDRLTVNRTASEVMAINHAAGQHPVQVSAATYTLVHQAVELSRQNFGFNALIGPLVKLWHIGFDNAHVPEQPAINDRLTLIDPNQVSCNDTDFSVYLKVTGMELDLGAIAKGYIADRIQDYWEAFGQRAGMINLGGNLLMVGTSPYTLMVNGALASKIPLLIVATPLPVSPLGLARLLLVAFTNDTLNLMDSPITIFWILRRDTHDRTILKVSLFFKDFY